MLTLALLGYAIVAASVGVRMLRGRRWLESRPRLGVFVWLVLSITTPMALLAAALSILTATSAGHSVADLLHACIMLLRQTSAGPLTASWATLLGVGLGLVVLRVPLLFAAAVAQGYRQRRSHRSALWLLATHRLRRGDLVVLEHPLPFAFCLPGRARTIVVSNSAVACLSPDELTAVIAHERAHLRGHDHLVLAWSDAVARGLRFLPALRWVLVEQSRLVEMAADDRAVRASSRHAVAAALLRLVSAPATVYSLGAVEHSVTARVHRLLAPRQPQWRLTTSAAAATVTLLGVLPALLLSMAWISAATAGHCPID